MQSEEETLGLLLATHFPNSVWTGEQHPLSPAVPDVWTGGWLRGLLPIEDWGGRLVFSPHIKLQVWTGYFRLYYKRDGRSLFLT